MSIPIPDVSINIRDGGLAVVPASIDGVSLKVGTSSDGDAGQFYAYRGNNVQKVADDLDQGPLPDNIIKNLIRSGGKTTIGYKSDAATPGASSAITRSGGTDGPTLSLSGTPYGYGDVIIEIVEGGERGTATWRYSLDGGDTWSGNIATAATYLLPTGVTVTFPITTATMSGSPTDVDFIAAADTIGRNTGSFVTDGFRVPMKLTIAGTVSNNGTLARTLTVVAAGLLTTDNGIVDEPNVNAPTITGHQPYVTGERYAWTDTAPIMSTGNVSAAMDAIIASGVYDPEFVHILAQPASTSAALTLATLLAGKVESAWLSKKFFFVVMEVPPATVAALAAEFANFVSRGVLICGHFAEISNERTGAVEKMNIARAVTHRIARNPIEVRLDRTVGDEDLEALNDVVALVPPTATSGDGYHDEGSTPGLNDARFTTLQSIIGKEGFFVTNALTMASGSSDFQQLPYLRIILKVARVMYQFGLTQRGRRTQKNPATGALKESFADSLESAGENAVKAALSTAIEAVRVLVDRDTPLAANPRLEATTRVVAGDYILEFAIDLGLAASLPSNA